MKITVDLQIFSGRPNPRWTAEGGEADLLSKLLKNRSFSQNPVPPGGLGYSGFALTVEENNKAENLRVYAGTIWDENSPEKVWEDQNGVEQLLLKMARQRGHGNLLETFGLQ